MGPIRPIHGSTHSGVEPIQVHHKMIFGAEGVTNLKPTAIIQRSTEMLISLAEAAEAASMVAEREADGDTHLPVQVSQPLRYKSRIQEHHEETQASKKAGLLALSVVRFVGETIKSAEKDKSSDLNGRAHTDSSQSGGKKRK